MLAYLARYTHRVTISNSRLIALDEGDVTFRYKDYRRNGQARYRTMTLSADEFIRRFLLHVLPKGFLITDYPQLRRYGTNQEHATVSAGLSDGAQQGPVSKGPQ